MTDGESTKLTPFDHTRMALQDAAPKFAEVLGEDVSPQRFVRVALTAISQQPSLLQCDRDSLMLSLMDCARLGLEPGGVRQQAHLVKFGSEAVLIPGYRGLIHLMRRSGFVQDAYAQVVHREDEFHAQYGTEPVLTHNPELLENPGDVVAYYAIAYPAHDGRPLFEVMRRDQVEEIRDRALQRIPKSKRASSPWVTDEEEMGRKTVLKRLWKYAPDDPQLAAAVQLDHSVERGEPQRLEDLDLDLTGGEGGGPATGRVAEMEDAVAAGRQAGESAGREIEARARDSSPDAGDGDDAGDGWRTDDRLPEGYRWKMKEGGYYHVRAPGGEVLNPETGKRAGEAAELAREHAEAEEAERAQEQATNGEDEPNRHLDEIPDAEDDWSPAQVKSALRYVVVEVADMPPATVTGLADVWFNVYLGRRGIVDPDTGEIHVSELSGDELREFYDAVAEEMRAQVAGHDTEMLAKARERGWDV